MADIDTDEMKSAFLSLRSHYLRRRVFEAVSFNVAHEAIWHTESATKNEALAAHAYRLAGFDKASSQEQAAQFALIVCQLRQDEFVEGTNKLLDRHSLRPGIR